MNGQTFGGVDAWSGPLSFLIPGPKEIVLVALVALALYGRVGSRFLLSTRHGRMIAPWLRLARESFGGAAAKPGPHPRPAASTPTSPPRPRDRDRWFWALALAGAAALAAWVATRIVIHHAATTP